MSRGGYLEGAKGAARPAAEQPHGARAGAAIAALLLALAGCVVHPEGEQEERDRAAAAGESYARPVPERALPVLGADSTLDDLVRHAMLANGELEKYYWDWRARLERIPQVASQPAVLEVSFETMISAGGGSLFDRSTIGIANDPATDLVWPGKLAAAGEAALADARAAGWHFAQYRDEIRARVVRAWVELALLAEEARIAEREARVLEALLPVAEARVRSGASPQQDVLKLRTQLDLARNEAARLAAQRPGALARLHAAAGSADPERQLAATLPAVEPVPWRDEDVRAHFLAHNPELHEHWYEVLARQAAARRARLEYLPDLSLSASFTGTVSQAVGAALTAPFLRRAAVSGMVLEAEALVAEAEANRRQMVHDMTAGLIAELATLRDAERQVALLDGSVLPRTRQTVDLTRAAYASGLVPFVELADSVRTQLEVERTRARVAAEWARARAEVERIGAMHSAERR